MNTSPLRRLAEKLASGNLSVDQFLESAATEQSMALQSATLDLARQQRCGFPEVIYGEGKSCQTLQEIIDAMRQRDLPVLATRIDAQKGEFLCERFPQAHYNAVARTLRVSDTGSEDQSPQGEVAIVTAGTSDLPVAEEARETLDWMNVHTHIMPDVGVAGPQRLLERVAELRQVQAVVCIAGMEGALPSVVGGHVACPVIAVPTSVGYGANLGGFTALFAMLNSCASNVAVVNIDAGFKAAYLAGMIAKQTVESRRD